ncbi:hypothetical protein [Methylobacterium sp. Leaf85]|uniref:hypothetical protein n=1 Tax=Methylobacterium sp. Leaf85 TaxID=1736241 RepID=UPI0006F3B4B8|nr:hypothetical protein [Methylobacterium sp. Leaf85]KQO42510.1 hypothetical protein ASF08_12995 [Methylobacterium sp. Leaf85]
MTDPGVAALPLRLVPMGNEGRPVGLCLTRADAAVLLGRIAPRLARYATLRLALADGVAVLFAPEATSDETPLPWCAAPLGWLSAAGPLLLPFGTRLDVPAPWCAEVARRLLDRNGLAGPALVVPEGDTLRLVDLAGSRALPDIDADRLGDQA